MVKTSHPAHTRARDTLYGLFIGDALAMPVHWYYNRQALNRDYGWVAEYKAPLNPHPDSILWRSSYRAPNPKGEILHDQARYWGQQGIHYHQFLRAGENTLNVKICGLLIDSIKESGRYDPNAFLKKYIAFMTTPGNHQDTYIEECHRNFFENYARGRPTHKCGVTEKHIGGLIGIVPIAAFYSKDSDNARKHALVHLALTHPGHKMQTAASLIIEILLKVFNGITLEAAIVEEIESQRHPLMGHPFKKWLADPDDWVIGPRLSTACYVEDSVPAVIYLALKYHTEPEKALIANTNLGGDNAARGSILGALLGASCGIEKFPRHWVDGLVDPPPDLN
jgi:ADP-ribosylglycohydrolase